MCVAAFVHHFMCMCAQLQSVLHVHVQGVKKSVLSSWTQHSPNLEAIRQCSIQNHEKKFASNRLGQPTSTTIRAFFTGHTYRPHLPIPCAISTAHARSLRVIDSS